MSMYIIYYILIWRMWCLWWYCWQLCDAGWDRCL